MGRQHQVQIGRALEGIGQISQSRRDFLKRSTGVALFVPGMSALLAACETDTTDDSASDEDDAAAEAEEDGAAESEETAESADEQTDDEESDDGEDPEAEDDASAAGGELVIVVPVEPASLDNWQATSTDAHPIIRNVQEALLNRDPETNELVGELATDWEQIDDNTWRFYLREGVTFHNGDPFNAEVAAYGINYTWSEENAFAIRSFIGPELNAEAVDEYTVDVVTDSPDPVLPSRLYFGPIPNMTQIEEDPDSLPDQPIGTGPYQFVEWNRGQYIQLTANPDWWGNDAEDSYGDATIGDVRFVFREESSVRASMVSAGEAHIGRFLSPEDCDTTPNCREMPSLEVIFLRPDTMHVAMSDIRIRQAIAHAIDRQAIADEFFGGGEPASQLISQAVDGYNPDLEPYEYDMERAQELVQEAADDGVPVDAEIVIANRNGIYLRHDEFAEYVANQLNEAGLNAQSQVIEPSQFNDDYFVPYDSIDEERGWVTTNPHGNEIMDLSRTASSYYRCDGSASTYCNEELDAAFEEALPLTGDERIEAFQEINRMIYEDYGVIPVITMPLFYGLAEDLTWEPRLDAFMLLKEMSFS